MRLESKAELKGTMPGASDGGAAGMAGRLAFEGGGASLQLEARVQLAVWAGYASHCIAVPATGRAPLSANGGRLLPGRLGPTAQAAGPLTLGARDG